MALSVPCEGHLYKRYQRHRTLWSLSNYVGCQELWLNRHCFGQHSNSLKHSHLDCRTAWRVNPEKIGQVKFDLDHNSVKSLAWEGHQPIYPTQRPSPPSSCTAPGLSCPCFSLLLSNLPSSVQRQLAGNKTGCTWSLSCLVNVAWSSPFSCLPFSSLALLLLQPFYLKESSHDITFARPLTVIQVHLQLQDLIKYCQAL